MAVSILAVDDEQNLLELLIKVLGKRGFRVKTALNGIEALKLLDTESFNLALLDLKMGPRQWRPTVEGDQGPPATHQGHHDDCLSDRRNPRAGNGEWSYSLSHQAG
jgi:CheY-like chemotaxis protein